MLCPLHSSFFFAHRSSNYFCSFHCAFRSLFCVSFAGNSSMSKACCFAKIFKRKSNNKKSNNATICFEKQHTYGCHRTAQHTTYLQVQHKFMQVIQFISYWSVCVCVQKERKKRRQPNSSLVVIRKMYDCIENSGLLMRLELFQCV